MSSQNKAFIRKNLKIGAGNQSPRRTSKGWRISWPGFSGGPIIKTLITKNHYNSRELNEFRFHLIAFESNKCAFIAHLVAVIRCRENGDDTSISFDFIAFILDFMGSHKDVQFIVVEEILSDVGSEGKADSSFAGVAAGEFPGVAPEDFAHDAFLRRFTEAELTFDVIKADIVLGEEASMDNKDSFVEDMAEREVAEKFAEAFVH
jgi:hypothetical protein